MARTPFKLRSGNSTPFKQMGSSPMKQTAIGGTVLDKEVEKNKPFFEKYPHTPKKEKGKYDNLKTTPKAAKQDVKKAKSEKKSKSVTSKKDPYAEALKKDPKLGSYVKERKKHKPGSAEYEAVQAKINKAYGKTRSSKLKSAQIAAQKKKDTKAAPATTTDKTTTATRAPRKTRTTLGTVGAKIGNIFRGKESKVNPYLKPEKSETVKRKKVKKEGKISAKRKAVTGLVESGNFETRKEARQAIRKQKKKTKGASFEKDSPTKIYDAKGKRRKDYKY